MTIAYVLLGAFILFAYTAEVVTGFGSIVIALSLGALFFPIEWLQTVLVPLSVSMTSYLTWKHREHIDWHLLLRLILPFMLVGTLSGYVLQPYLGGAGLKMGFAVLILWFALRELRRMQVGAVAAAKPGWWSRCIIFMAGITHGLFTSGGPLLVYGLAGTTLNKSRLRATLIFVWFSLNSMLTVLFFLQGRLHDTAPFLLAYLPLIPLGVVIGERLHHRIDETGFRKLIYGMLVLAAIGLLSGTLWRTL